MYSLLCVSLNIIDILFLCPICGQPCNWIRRAPIVWCEVGGVALLSGCEEGRVATVQLKVVLGCPKCPEDID